ncbi:dipeptidyl carboxypeptidase II [Porphyrobacter algicida]|uniref:Dipeptidyl carboxypeptidase II n=1 Tax=Qipengyuania algicida TaxID=1836209 RepID=A0A845AF27_9SPHN|nr:M3 family metallopeptidase [Qipengyuania algicida]MXP27395.1 dipeptidyl carboxypeptidase II [Qipengyuania algicida]
MKAPILATTALAATLLAGCMTTSGDSAMAEAPAAPAPTTASNDAIPQGTGPFAQESNLPFHAPDFTKIKESDYVPGFEQGMAIQTAEVKAITDNPAAPTFDNTIVALEKSGRMLGRVSAVFSALTSADTTPGLDKIDEEMGPKLSAHSDSIMLNPKLFARVSAVYDQRAQLGLDNEDMKLLEHTYKAMVHAGAKLTPAQRERVVAINSDLSKLTTQFGQMVRDGTVASALVVDNKADLAGMSDAEIQAAAKAAAEKGMAGKYLITLQNTTQQPALAELNNRDVRKKLFDASYYRDDKGNQYDTRDLISKIVQLRAEKAALFGDPDWATYVMWDRMAKNPKTALAFMDQMVPPLAATQRSEAAELDKVIKQDGGDFTVKPWDWFKYSDQLKKAKFDIDPDEVKQYFEIHRVLEDGVFYAANQLYGLTFKRRTDIPVYNKDVWVYTVYDKDGSELGLFYFDPYQRASKSGGAWMSNFVEQSHLFGDKPVIYNVLNIPKAPAGEPQLISFDWAETMFHEFGHALHGFFGNEKYPSLSGTNVARDFVEFPSQVNEMWASYPKVLEHYAKNYKTGAPIPKSLVDKIEASSKFNQGYEFGETVEAALLDMKWHSLSPDQAKAIDTPAKVDAYEKNSLEQTGLEIGLVPPRYRSTYFNHIFSSPVGYSAGYYSYLWTQMLDHDSRHWFLAHGGLTRENGQHFRDTVLSRGSTQDYYKMFENFTGHAPSPKPLLEDRGLMKTPSK